MCTQLWYQDLRIVNCEDKNKQAMCDKLSFRCAYPLWHLCKWQALVVTVGYNNR